MEVAIANLQVTLVDYLMGEYSEKGLTRIEDKWMVNLGTLFNGANRTGFEPQEKKLWGLLTH
jgi:hypothetical protein